MKYILRMVSLLICMAMALGLAGCSKESPYPEGYEKYKAVIGDTREESLKKLKLNESDLLAETQNSYLLPTVVEFCGYKFEVRLYYDRISDRLFSVQYQTFTDEISGVPVLYDKMIELFGTPGNTGFEEQYFTRLAEKKKGSLSAGWSMYRFTEEHHPEFAKYLEEINTARDRNFTWAWNANLSCNYRTDLEKYSILMSFRVGENQSPSWRPGQERN